MNYSPGNRNKPAPQPGPSPRNLGFRPQGATFRGQHYSIASSILLPLSGFILIQAKEKLVSCFCVLFNQDSHLQTRALSYKKYRQQDRQAFFYFPGERSNMFKLITQTDKFGKKSSPPISSGKVFNIEYGNIDSKKVTVESMLTKFENWKLTPHPWGGVGGDCL